MSASVHEVEIGTTMLEVTRAQRRTGTLENRDIRDAPSVIARLLA